MPMALCDAGALWQNVHGMNSYQRGLLFSSQFGPIICTQIISAHGILRFILLHRHEGLLVLTRGSVWYDK